jgi:hypothetical protein
MVVSPVGLGTKNRCPGEASSNLAVRQQSVGLGFDSRGTQGHMCHTTLGVVQLTQTTRLLLGPRLARIE